MKDWTGVHELMILALKEDIGHGDITTNSLIPAEQRGQGVFVSRAEGILAGIELSCEVFRLLDDDMQLDIKIQDGEEIHPGSQIAVVEGPMRTLLTGERLALNFLQRLSGIATHTYRAVDLIRYSTTQLLDTRKTTPGMRQLEKYAVQVGGARNHRFGLFDGVMIKDNHIKAVGSIQKAVSLARQQVPHTIKIEVEVENLEQLQEALESCVDIILLDNMDLDTMRQAVEITDGRALLEASGGITEATLAEIARTGVDFISMGALTHSAPSLDISFDII